MSRNHKDSDAPCSTLKNEFARQRWELFHRAIAHAKQSNSQALLEADESAVETRAAGPRLSIVR